jgi:TRAP-type C4-dicarboxylate transport system substrate-binding protein
MINRKRYDELPPQAKAAIDKHSYAMLSKAFGEKTQSQWQKSRTLVQQQTTTLAPEQQAEWKKRLEPIAAEWTKSVPDGDKVLAAFRSEVSAIRAGK